MEILDFFWSQILLAKFEYENSISYLFRWIIQSWIVRFSEKRHFDIFV